jgi:hypothetical protein
VAALCTPENFRTNHTRVAREVLQLQLQATWCANSQSCIRMWLWGVIPPPQI